MAKDSVAGILKQIIGALRKIAMANTLALKRKTRAIKARLIVFSLLTDKKFLLTSISRKLQSLIGKHHHNHGVSELHRVQSMLLCDSIPKKEVKLEEREEVVDEYEEKYPDLRHSLFEEEGESAIEIVKHSKEEKGEEFSLEQDIDQVADLFIRNFHRQMRMQKQQSIKRNQELLCGTV